MTEIEDEQVIDLATATVKEVFDFLFLYTLVYLRNGSSRPAYEGQLDSQRDLDEAGVEEARQSSELRVACGIRPALVIVSPAKRCMQTAVVDPEILENKMVVRRELYRMHGNAPAFAEADADFFSQSYAKLGDVGNEAYFNLAVKYFKSVPSGYPGYGTYDPPDDAPFQRWTDGDGKTGGALRAIADEIQHAHLEPGATVMVVGHGNFGRYLLQRYAHIVFDFDLRERAKTMKFGTANALVFSRGGRYRGLLSHSRGGLIGSYVSLFSPHSPPRLFMPNEVRQLSLANTALGILKRLPLK